MSVMIVAQSKYATRYILNVRAELLTWPGINIHDADDATMKSGL